MTQLNLGKVRGEKGDKGDIGDTGPIGLTGDIGPKGDTGEITNFYDNTTLAIPNVVIDTNGDLQRSIRNPVTIKGLGDDQTWYSYSNRSMNTTYYNTTGRPISVSITLRGRNVGYTLAVNNITVAFGFVGNGQFETGMPLTAIVPTGASYSATGSGILTAWLELR